MLKPFLLRTHQRTPRGCASVLVHAHVVEHAPFRPLLGPPFQHALLCRLEDLPSGEVEVSVQDQADPVRRITGTIPSCPRIAPSADSRNLYFSCQSSTRSHLQPQLQDQAHAHAQSWSQLWPPDIAQFPSQSVDTAGNRSPILPSTPSVKPNIDDLSSTLISPATPPAPLCPLGTSSFFVHPSSRPPDGLIASANLKSTASDFGTFSPIPAAPSGTVTPQSPPPPPPPPPPPTLGNPLIEALNKETSGDTFPPPPPLLRPESVDNPELLPDKTLPPSSTRTRFPATPLRG